MRWRTVSQVPRFQVLLRCMNFPDHDGDAQEPENPEQYSQFETLALPRRGLGPVPARWSPKWRCTARF